MVILSRPKLQAFCARPFALHGGEPDVEPIQPSAHHRTVTFSWVIVPQQITLVCAISWVVRGIAKWRCAHQDNKAQNGAS